ncbi:MAG: cytidylyltransferase domain-containing protein [Alcaligenes nematophilus]|uniref:acylneuraminate cytidylyltransferase family protein n=1 Tax=Alcaligenes nematophilus TaxID=2994643 RepID=UPI002AA80718|nr:acylneuraminate cytidylyltransferase family protein [Alcaligenes faecalis]
MKNKNWTAIIPARNGSKGLSKKNIRKLGGIELYKYSVACAQNSGANKIIVSTDIEKILSEEQTFIAHKRPPELASDTTLMKDVLLDVLKSRNIQGTVVLLQPTSPLRKPESIHKALELQSSGKYDLVLSVSEADKSILKYGQLQGDSFLPIKEAEYCFSNRQQLPSVYRPNGAIYVFDAEWFIKNDGFTSNKIGAIITPEEQSIDIDDEHDLAMCQLILDKEKTNP